MGKNIPTLPHNKKLGTIFNNDINNILYAMPGENTTPDDYRRAVYAILDSKPGVLAQNVGLPDPVNYRSGVATTIDKYNVEVYKQLWPDQVDTAIRQTAALTALFDSGTDPLALTIDACRERGTPVVASYRMNAEDWYYDTWMLSDFGRMHPEWRIPLSDDEKRESAKYESPPHELTGALDPAVPDVYEHRMKIFTEVARQYDIDGIEFDFRRWWHMVSDPLRNYHVLTQMVRDTRSKLDEVAKCRGRRLLLGARVGPSLDDPPGTEYPGGETRTDISCRQLGLDVKKWVEEGIVDYLCPSLFWPRWPGLPNVREFVELARGTDVGIYPTLFPLPAWLGEEGATEGPTRLSEANIDQYRSEFCKLALDIYRDGADGVSTFNWYFHLRKAKVANLWTEYYGYGPEGEAVQAYLLSILGDRAALSRYGTQRAVARCAG